MGLTKTKVGFQMKRVFIIIVIISFHSFGIPSLHKITINKVVVNYSLTCEKGRLPNVQTLSFLVEKKLNEYGILNKSDSLKISNVLYFDLKCITPESNENMCYLLEMELSQAQLSTDQSPRRVYFSDSDFGFVPDPASQLNEIIETSVKEMTKTFINFWVSYNKN